MGRKVGVLLGVFVGDDVGALVLGESVGGAVGILVGEVGFGLGGATRNKIKVRSTAVINSRTFELVEAREKGWGGNSRV